MRTVEFLAVLVLVMGACNNRRALVDLDGGLPDAMPGKWVAVQPGAFTPEESQCGIGTGYWQGTLSVTRAFEMQDTEVTQGQFKGLMGYNPSESRDCGDGCPVECNWYDAASYCNALSALADLPECYSCTGEGSLAVSCQEAPGYEAQAIYSCTGYRLPTEAEWELAYRGGASTPLYNGPITACGCSPKDPNADAIAWYCGNAGETPHPVRGKHPNALGLHDMAGNVWEWCHDFSDNTPPPISDVDPVGRASGTTFRTVRGGAWFSKAGDVWASRRVAVAPYNRGFSVGLRCVRTLP
jgi:formylglycine-generating enzyme required for sulfatase activity